MLAYACGDDGFVFHVFGHDTELFNNGLGLDEAIEGFFLVVKGVSAPSSR